jgi:curved DNA-binding protein
VKFRDYYDVLGVSRSSSQEEIQKAYRKLARQFHPDINKTKGAEDRFKEINEANEVLSDPEKRKKYDTLGANWKAGQEFQPPPGWEGGSFQFNGGGVDGFSDFFEAFFGGSSPFGGASFGGARSFTGPVGAQARSPERLEAEFMITLEDAIRGASKQIQLRDTAGKTRSLTVNIPPGTTEGTTMKLTGKKGESDVYLKVRFSPHARYSLDGQDLVVKLPVSPWEAALGAKVDLVLPDGGIKLMVPPGSQSGSKLRVRGRGLPKKGGSRGDVLAEIKVVVPTDLSQSEREIFEKLSNVSRFNPRSST